MEILLAEATENSNAVLGIFVVFCVASIVWLAGWLFERKPKQTTIHHRGKTKVTRD